MTAVALDRASLEAVLAGARAPVPVEVDESHFRGCGDYIVLLRGRVERLAAVVEGLLDERDAAVAYFRGFQEWQRVVGPGVASCPCRPENGGSGVCGCTVGGPQVTYAVSS